MYSAWHLPSSHSIRVSIEDSPAVHATCLNSALDYVYSCILLPNPRVCLLPSNKGLRVYRTEGHVDCNRHFENKEKKIICELFLKKGNDKQELAIQEGSSCARNLAHGKSRKRLAGR